MIPLLDKLWGKLHITSVTEKVIMGMSLILITVIGILTYYDMVTRIKYHLEKQEERAYEISNTVMRSIEYPMLDGDMEAVQAILESLYKLKDLRIVNLCDLTGTIRYSGLPANVKKFDDSQATEEALDTGSLVKDLEVQEGEKILLHAMPIINEENCYKCHGSENEILGILTVGISWDPVEERVTEMRNREVIWGLTSVIIVGIFLFIFLSKFVTKPLSSLTRLSDEISRGKTKVGLDFGREVKCWEIEKCTKTNCPAYGNTNTMCWYVDGTLCFGQPSGTFPEKLDECRTCKVYKSHVGDETVQLADSLKHMVSKLDISEKEIKKLEQKTHLIQASKMSTLGEMASGIAHELNQPLSVIRMGATFLSKMIQKGKGIQDEELKNVVQEIVGQVDRASAIINHMRDFSRIGVKATELDVNEPIRNIFGILGQQFKVRNIEVELDLDDNLPHIMADSNKLEQVLLNLVVNARQAIEEKSESGGKVTIKSFSDKGQAAISVSDTGNGIPEHILDKIFEPFFTTKKVGVGTGLGLSISYGIVKDYGGTIDVKTEVGLGTTFLLKFPPYSDAK
jgi:signal transduction histidine kinase